MAPLTLTPGTRLGPYEILSALGVGGMGEVYRATDTKLKRQVAIKVLPESLAAEILSPLGAGGMGEVYKARDTRLDRTVAIKILPETLAGDPQFRDRFEREAKAIAALTHPHICTLYDVGRHEGIDYLVMEHLEGQTLADRLTKGALPLDQTLAIATQIADALSTAHRAGITHRDLKPGNIFLVRSGGASAPPIAKLLDFGLAKASAPVIAGAGGDAADVTAELTAQGAILGTFHYMATEQLEGKEADARTDIFAFGAVVYEMLTGRRASPPLRVWSGRLLPWAIVALLGGAFLTAALDE